MHVELSQEIIAASKGKVTLGVLTCVVPAEYLPAGRSEISTLVKTTWEKQANQPKDAIRAMKEVSCIRDVYQALGKNPNKFPGSNESLLLRASKGQYPRSFHPLVDVNNACSVKFRRSIGIYDLDKAGKSVVFRRGNKGETYEKLDGRTLDLNSLPVLSDESGPFGSPTSDSARAIITDTTTRAAFIIFSFDGAEYVGEQLREIEDLVVGKLGCTMEETYIADTDRPCGLDSPDCQSLQNT